VTEIWKDVHGYEGMYKVSNLGRLKRIFKSGKENFLKGKLDKDGYVCVILSRSQSKKHYRLHRLVAETFVPNLENKPQVNHKDRNKQNCEASNLEWVSGSENVVHAYSTGRKVYKRPIVQYTKSMDIVSLWDSIREAGRVLKISEHNINSCCNGKLSTAGGYVWRYREVDI
jgi:hypothetical protein